MVISTYGTFSKYSDPLTILPSHNTPQWQSENMFLEHFANVLKKNTEITHLHKYSDLFTQYFVEAPLTTIGTWVFLGMMLQAWNTFPIFGKFLLFFFADPLKICQVGWGSVAAQLFSGLWVQNVSLLLLYIKCNIGMQTQNVKHVNSIYLTWYRCLLHFKPMTKCVRWILLLQSRCV